MALWTSFSISASYGLSFTVDKITYATLSTNTVKVTGFNFSMTEVTIPSTVEYKNVIYQVKEIDDKGLCGFKTSSDPRSKMTTLIISEGVEKIGNNAVTSNEKLKTISLPASLIEIGDKAFYKLEALVEYTIPVNNNLSRIGSEAFSECPKLFKEKPLLLPANISEIGAKAFQYDNFASVVIPQNVTVINERTFGSCSLLTSVTLHEGITRIEKNAFEYDDQLDNLDYDFPETLEYIGAGAFYGVPGIRHLILHGNLGKINISCFAHCNNLEYVWLQEGITEVAQWAFGTCEKLTYIVLPSTIQSVKSGAFGDPRASLLDYEGHAPRNFFFLSETPFTIEYTPTTDGGNAHPSLGTIEEGDCFYVKESAVDAYKEKWKYYSRAASKVNFQIPFNSNLSYSTNLREFDTDYHVTAIKGNLPFVATDYTKNWARFTSLDDGIVPALVPVLIRIKSDENTWYQIAEQQGAQLSMTNYLKGVTYADEIFPKTDDGFINYVLYNGEFCRFNNAGILGDHKAYLQLPGAVAAKYSISFVDDYANGISEVASGNKLSAIYSINGLRVINPSKGIYIKNGKKIIVK